MSHLLDSLELPYGPTSIEITIALVYQTKTDNTDTLNKLCKPCVRSKLTRVIRCNKSMTAITQKLEEVHTDL